MGLADKLKDLTKQAQDAAATHKDELHRSVLKAEALADQQTGGRYHDQILKAGQKADTFVENIEQPPSATPEAAERASSTPPAQSGRVETQRRP